ncbi:MAG: DHH family phosphoesterase, partial [Oscillospiraceae bacterium]|nr:DHH family phosphoesterase [Oscillospiraceae bacterium]
DLDCIGAATAVVCIAHKLEKNAKIVVDQKNTASKMLIDKLKALPEYEDCFISPDEAVLRADTRSLLVVVDTNRPEQVESRTLLEACNRVVVIDHHRRAASYIQNAALTFHEPFASSVCELMSEIMQELLEQPDISRAEAEAVLSGIMLDTKNFTIRTGERTFEAAAFLRRFGADTSEVKKLLQSDVSSTVAKYQILQSMRVYRGNIGMAVPETPQDRVVAAQAADEMLNISGIEASIVAYPTEDGGVVVSARSIGDINVQLLLENLGGGGNKSAAGAQIANISIRDAVNSICKSIDEYFAQDK